MIDYRSKFSEGDIIRMPSGLGCSQTTTYDIDTRQTVPLGSHPYWLVNKPQAPKGFDPAGKPYQIIKIMPFQSSIPGSYHLFLLQEAKADATWQQMIEKRGIYARIHLIYETDVIGRIGRRAIEILTPDRPIFSAKRQGQAQPGKCL